MKRTMSSFRPLGAVSDSISVTKPNWYLRSVRSLTCSTVFTEAAMSHLLLDTQAHATGALGCEARVDGTQPFALFGDLGGGKVDLVGGREAAEPDAQRRVRQLVVDADGAQHVRRVDRRRGAG